MNLLSQAIKKNVTGGPLLGMTLHHYDMAFVEIVALLGFHSVWIEMEHLTITHREAADLCRVGSALGLVTMIRVPDARRETVLKAAECGPDIIDLPMGNSREELEQLVRHARYAPDGERGFFSSSRALKYGIYEDIAGQRELVNRELCLMSQIETREAAERAEELCRVPGIDAVFLGMGDLSTSFGLAGQVNNPVVVAAADRAISVAKSHGKMVAVAGSASDAAEWGAKGVDIVYCGSDTACLRNGAKAVLDDAARSLERKPNARKVPA